MAFLNSVLNQSKKYEEPFSHWELNQPLTEEQVKEIVIADIGNPSEHNLNNDGTIEKRKFHLRRNARRGSYKNPVLTNGDLIVVGNNAFNITSEIIDEITKPFRGIITTYALIKTISD